MATVRDFFNYINELAPLETQESWDNSGMLVGDMNAEVKKAIVVLDIDINAVEKAKELGANLIISQLGGPDGELGAAMRYLNQRYSMPYREVAAVLSDIGISFR